MIKIVLNVKLKVKQALDKQDCDKVPKLCDTVHRNINC